MSTTRFHEIQEHLNGRWQAVSIPMPTAKADAAYRDTKRRDPSRRLRLQEAVPVSVPADNVLRGSSARFAAARIARDCRVAA